MPQIHENSTSLSPAKKIKINHLQFFEVKNQTKCCYYTPIKFWNNISLINMRADLGAIARLLPCVTQMAHIQILETTFQLVAVKPHTFTLPGPPFLETSCTEPPFILWIFFWNICKITNQMRYLIHSCHCLSSTFHSNSNRRMCVHCLHKMTSNHS